VLWGSESRIRSRSAEELDVFDGDGQESGTSRCGSNDSSEEQGDQNLRKKERIRISIEKFNFRTEKKLSQNSPAWKPLFSFKKSGVVVDQMNEQVVV
jgi:hypothetical protein